MDDKLTKRGFLYYILDDDKNIVGTNSVVVWAKFCEEPEKRVVAQHTATFTDDKGKEWDIYISTVFLGIDHNFGEKGAPLLFETMAFPIEEHAPAYGKELFMERYTTFDEAFEAHYKLLEKLDLKNIESKTE